MVSIMERNESTSSAETMPQGAELADALYNEKLATAKTVGEVRRELDGLMQETGEDEEATTRMQELKISLDEATESGGHDNVKLEDDLGSGVLGRHTFATGEAEAVKEQFTPDQIVNNTRKTLALVVEENKPDIGHPSQDPTARVNVIIDDKQQSSTAAFEGNVGINIQHEYGIVRTDAPEQDYKEGERMVKKLGAEEVDSYIRKGGSHAGEHMQQLVWRKTPGITYERMLDEGRAVGMSDDEIVSAARNQGKLPEGIDKVLAA